MSSHFILVLILLLFSVLKKIAPLYNIIMFFFFFVLVIEVAIGEYGRDVLSKLVDSLTAADDEYTNINLDYPTSADSKNSQLKNGGMCSVYL